MSRTLCTLLVLSILIAAGAAVADQPVLTVTALPAIGTFVYDGIDDPAVTITLEPNDPFGVAFVLSADASAYGEQPDGFRAGFDVADINDPTDPGWLTPDWTLTNVVGYTTFAGGLHSFVVKVRDTAGNITTAVIQIDAEGSVAVSATSWGTLKAQFAGE